jgi:hypothetical protein
MSSFAVKDSVTKYLEANHTLPFYSTLNKAIDPPTDPKWFTVEFGASDVSKDTWCYSSEAGYLTLHFFFPPGLGIADQALAEAEAKQFMAGFTHPTITLEEISQFLDYTQDEPFYHVGVSIYYTNKSI